MKNITWWTRAGHFVDGWHLLRCQIHLFPHPRCGWPCDFCGGGGSGWFSLGKNFFLKSLELEIFSLAHNSVRLFFQHYVRHERNFFQCSILFFPVISLQALSPRNQSAAYFFSEITYNPLKSQMVGPLKYTKYLLSWQILICQSFLKPLETIRDKTL